MNLCTKQKPTYRHSKQIHGYQRGKQGAENCLVKDIAIIEKVEFRELKVHYGRTEGMVCGDETVGGTQRPNHSDPNKLY